MEEKMSLESIEKEEENLNNKLEDLSEKKKQLCVAEGESILCSICNRYVSRPNGEEKKEGICWRCITERGKEKKRKELLSRMKGAKLVDLKIANVYPSRVTLKSVTLFKNDQLFDLTADGDGDYDSFDFWMCIEDNVTTAITDDILAIPDRPGMKTRDKDKVLDICKKRKKE